MKILVCVTVFFKMDVVICTDCTLLVVLFIKLEYTVITHFITDVISGRLKNIYSLYLCNKLVT
jgi:hypothetical protein